MSNFYVRACPKGHFEVDIKPVREGEKCRECGGQLIDSCPECGGLIKRWYLYGSSMMLPLQVKDYVLPDFCPHCGEKLPWAGKDKKRVANRQGR